MTCDIESEKNLYNEFPAYFSPDKSGKKEQIIFDSNLKGKKFSESNRLKPIKIEIDDDLTTGLYKVIFEIQNVQDTKHFTDISKGVLVNNEIKDIYFHKIDVISVNGKTTVTTIFEILTNPFPLIFVIYALASMGVSITGAILLKNVSTIVTSISSNIIKIGASAIVIILGIKVISKW